MLDPAECDSYGDVRNAPALSPAELKMEGAFCSPFVRSSESTPPIVTPGGKSRSNACRDNKVTISNANMLCYYYREPLVWPTSVPCACTRMAT